MRPLIISLIIFCFAACNSESQSKDITTNTREEERQEDGNINTNDQYPTINERDVEAQWLKSNIEQVFNLESGSMEKICTPRYFEFKRDELETYNDEEGAMDIKAFNKKWS